MTQPPGKQTPEAQAFGALLNDALNRHPRVHLPPYRVPAPIVHTPKQTEAQMRAHLRGIDDT